MIDIGLLINQNNIGTHGCMNHHRMEYKKFICSYVMVCQNLYKHWCQNIKKYIASSYELYHVTSSKFPHKTTAERGTQTHTHTHTHTQVQSSTQNSF